MSTFLAFLQVLQILGKWSLAVIRNFHIVSVLIIAVNLLDRLTDRILRPTTFWEFIAIVYLIGWYHLKYKSRNRIEEPATQVNIENRNVIQLIQDIDDD